jgi:NADH-quinone oxidoreductase subunit L
MAGPTPVSALIHAATMVTAGIYMMTRLNFMYFLAPNTMLVVATVGALTALFAATIALVQNDIKKVLAYSTVSQLGFMVLGCGVGAFDAGVFHLLTHACFKALLFLGAGSVIVAMHHKQDMREMGGLKSFLPITHFVFLVGVLAIIGFPGLSGFFSKDEILWRTFIFPQGGKVLWAIAALAAVCTSFYMVRLLFLTFYGPNRSDHHTKEHLHETGPVMWAPLVVLAIASAFIGYLNVPHVIPFPTHLAFSHYLENVLLVPEAAQSFWSFAKAEHSFVMEVGVMAVSIVGMVLGSGYAWMRYSNVTKTAPDSESKGVHNLLRNKYWIDELYFAWFVEPLKNMAFFLWSIVDKKIIDGLVNGVGSACAFLAGVTSFRMSGSLHRHGMAVVIGMLCLILALAA